MGWKEEISKIEYGNVSEGKRKVINGGNNHWKSQHRSGYQVK